MKKPQASQLIAMFVLATLLLAACGGDASTPSSTGATDANPPAAQPTPPQPAVTLPDDPKAAILQALRGQLTAGPYRSTTTISADGSAQSVTGLVIPPDRMHVMMDIDGMKTEMIYIGDKVWSRQGDAAWVATERMGAAGAGLLDESMIADTEATITEAALVGPAEVEGVAALLYTFTTDLSKSTVMPMEGAVNAKVWIDTATGLPIRQETEDTTTGTPSTMVQIIEYDPTITIEAPAE